MKTKLQSFKVWYNNQYGIAIEKIKATGFRDCYNRCPAYIQRSFFEIVNAETEETLSRIEFYELWKSGNLT